MLEEWGIGYIIKMFNKIGKQLIILNTIILAAFLITAVGTLFIGLKFNLDMSLFVDNKLFLLLILNLIIIVLFILISAWISLRLTRRSIKKLENKFNQQMEFVAIASHEIRTPLSIVLSSLDAVLMDSSSHFSAFTAEVLQNMREEIIKMSKTLHHLLSLARADLLKSDLHFKKLDLYNLAEQVIISFQPIAAEKKIELHFECVSPLFIIADEEHIRRLLFLLIDNGIKYTPDEGSVKLTIMNQKKKVIIKVLDTGIGIPQKYSEKIFESFFRVNNSNVTEGSGLGLSIAKTIVELHRGTIKVESEPGHGSVFTIVLPYRI